MPIYDFKCTECDHQDEMMRKMSADSTMACPECHKETFSKMLSAPSFQLNGTGWYATDFKDKPKSNNKPAVKDDSTAEPKAEPKTETKTVEPVAAATQDETAIKG